VPRYIAFLRGMNLGKRRLPMTRLKVLFEELDYSKVETFIASGNVLFSAPAGSLNRREARIAAHLESALGYSVDTFVRPAEAVAAIGRANVFPEEGREGITVHVGFWQQALPPAAARKFAAVRTAADEFRVQGAEYYWLCRGRTSDSKVWTLPELKVLRLPTSTMRNMTSIRKLLAKHFPG
jgi:uncharacterized protein (DUF1697 family)